MIRPSLVSLIYRVCQREGWETRRPRKVTDLSWSLVSLFLRPTTLDILSLGVPSPVPSLYTSHVDPLFYNILAEDRNSELL